MGFRTSGSPISLRSEDWSVGGGDTVRTYYLYDPTSDKWLSTHMETITQGRNAGGVTGFIRTVNGILLSNIAGPVVPHQGTIVGLTAIAGNTPSNMEIRVYNLTSLVLSEAWSGVQNLAVSCDADFDSSNLSTYLINTSPTYTAPNVPMVQLYLKWRL